MRDSSLGEDLTVGRRVTVRAGLAVAGAFTYYANVGGDGCCALCLPETAPGRNHLCSRVSDG